MSNLHRSLLTSKQFSTRAARLSNRSFFTFKSSSTAYARALSQDYSTDAAVHQLAEAFKIHGFKAAAVDPLSGSSTNSISELLPESYGLSSGTTVSYEGELCFDFWKFYLKGRIFC